MASTQGEVLEKADAVVSCSPDRFHAQTLAEVCDLGKPVLVEKPLAVTDEDLLLIEKYLLSGDYQVSTCHPRRMDPPFEYVKENLEKYVEKLGKIKLIEFGFTYPKPRENQPILHSSLLTDHFGHEFDLIEYLVGQPESVSCMNALKPGEDKQLNYKAEGLRSDGIRFVFHGKRTDPKQDTYAEFLTIEFQKGKVKLNADEGTLEIETKSETVKVLVPSTNYEKRFDSVNRNFAQMLQGKTAYVNREQIWRNTVSAVKLDKDDSCRLHGIAGYKNV